MFEKMSEKSVMHLSGKINTLKMGRRSLVSSFFKWKCYKELCHSQNKNGLSRTCSTSAQKCTSE